MIIAITDAALYVNVPKNATVSNEQMLILLMAHSSLEFQ